MLSLYSNRLDPLGSMLDHPEYADIPEDVRAVSSLLSSIFEQGSFDDFIEAIESDAYPGRFDPANVEGGHLINVIPSERKSTCTSTLLAVARGRGSRSPFSFDNVMQGVKKHLIDCQNVVKLVVVASDTWDSSSFARNHAEELAAWRRRGIRFIFSGVGIPRNQIFPISIDLT